MNQNLELLVKVPEKSVGELFANGLAKILPSCEVKIMQLSQKDEVTIQQPEKEEPKLPERENESRRERRVKKLIKLRCKECGDLSHLVCERDEDDKYHIVCRRCGEHYAFSEKELAKVGYTCESCGRTSYFYMPDIEELALDYDLCRDCRAEIALQYIPSSGMYTSK